jgi:hypothetical protein
MRPLLSARQSREVNYTSDQQPLFSDKSAALVSSERKQNQMAARKVCAFVMAVKCD